jgi:hypothetical protein
MPRLRSQSGPIVKCAYQVCDVHFRKWRKRLYCSDRCKKEAWRAAHKPYYARLHKERLERIKLQNRHKHRYRWVEEGKEHKVPEHLTMAEAIAQATPSVIAQIKEIIGPEVE